MKVTIEYLQAIQDERARINNTPLNEIEFYENGKKIEIDEDIIKEFEFTGLNNIDFITSGFYLGTSHNTNKEAINAKKDKQEKT